MLLPASSLVVLYLYFQQECIGGYLENDGTMEHVMVRGYSIEGSLNQQHRSKLHVVFPLCQMERVHEGLYVCLPYFFFRFFVVSSELSFS